VRRAALIACAGALALAGLGGSAAAAIPKAFYGVVPNTTLDDSDYSRMNDARVGSFRFLIGWPTVQATRQSGFNFSAFDPTVAEAAAHHLDLLPVLTGTPGFESGGCTTQGCVNHIHVSSHAQQQDWKNFVIAVVQRYGPHGAFWTANPSIPYDPVTRYQIWNEQNNPKRRNPATTYAKLVSLSKSAVKSVDSSGKVILGGMFGAPPGGPKNAAWNYLKVLYRHGGAKNFDGVALHPYAPTVKGLSFQIKRIRQVMKTHHDSSTPIYITEIGWGSGKPRHGGGRGNAFIVGTKGQKTKLKQSFGYLTGHRSSLNIGGIFWFSWKDPSNGSPDLCSFCLTSGLCKSNGKTAKPALGAFKSFTKKTK
jgi:hypothetical protein